MNLDSIKLLKDMVAIPSVNPMRADTDEPVEREMAVYIEEVLRQAGIDCERQAIAPGRENVIAVVQPTERRTAAKGVMLNSHMDTVPVSNMTIEPFDPVEKEGHLFGRGSCDAKASIAAMLSAVVAYASRSKRDVPVVFAAMADEEFSFAGSWKLIQRDWPVDACVIGEPTKLARVIAHKGVVRWKVNIVGTSAHASTPELGKSAIFDAARVTLALEKYAGHLAISPVHPLLGRPTINVGRIAGGQSVNIVPDRCEVEIERRLLPGEDGLVVVHDCEKFVRDLIGSEIEFSFEEPYLVDPALETSDESRVVRVLGLAQEAEFGVEREIRGVHYGTDGSKLSRAGIATVVCGPGDIADAHTKDEHIEIEQVELAKRLYTNLLENWSQRL